MPPQHALCCAWWHRRRSSPCPASDPCCCLAHKDLITNGPGLCRTWRVNPSYLPVPLLRRLAIFDPEGPWGALAGQAAKLVRELSLAGIVPDWAAYRAGDCGHGFLRDPVKGDVSSYDAVRGLLVGWCDTR
ncbi:glycosyl hydrolase family 8 [Cupriavidus basilensis]